jgi:hypothetical protein
MQAARGLVAVFAEVKGVKLGEGGEFFVVHVVLLVVLHKYPFKLSFPRRRESMVVLVDSRLRGNDKIISCE